MTTKKKFLSLLLLTASCGAPAAQEQKAQPAPAEATPAAPSAAAAPVEQAKPEAQHKMAAASFDSALPERAVFFSNPERTSPEISPDGKHLAFLAPKDGVLNVWLAEKGDIAKAKPITDDKSRGVRQFFWAHDSKHILYPQDKGGDENWRIYSVDVATAVVKDLTPMDKVHATILGVSARKPKQIVVGLNDRNPELHDLYLIDIATGDRKLLEKNEQGFGSIEVDEDYVVRTATKSLPDGGQTVLKKVKGKWEPLATLKQQDAMGGGIQGFDAAGKTAYWLDSTNRNTAALYALDLASGKKSLLAEDNRVDIGQIVTHPTKNTLQAVGVNWDKQAWKVIDKTWGQDLEALKKAVGDGEISILSRTDDDKIWVVAQVVDNGPAKFHKWERAAKKATFLFTGRPALEKVQLAHMLPREIKSRDGLTLMSYLTLPITSDADNDGVPSQPLPLVLLVHGGPWGRDSWGFNGMHQWLQSRGYAVLSVNFRGSTGFGKNFVNAGDKEWGRKMHDDLLDAVAWAVEQKITETSKVAIMGGSYGGYATLAGLTFTPEKFACGVDIVGPSNLRTLLASVPPYWKPMVEMFTSRVGDPATPDGAKLLEERSPLTKADAIQRPLLIGQGANDPRVKQAESDQIVKAMQQKALPVTYVLYPDEGHGFQRPENRMSFNAVAEIFLSQCLGGKAQPIGTDFSNSSITVPQGAEQVDSLEGALKTGTGSRASR